MSESDTPTPKRPRGRPRKYPRPGEGVAPTTAADPPPRDFAKYRTDPVLYAREVMGLTLSPMQEKICGLIFVPPYRVLVRCGHSVGKTHVGAVLVSWFHDCYPHSAVISTAPTHKDVTDVLWRKIRTLRARAGLGGMVGNTAPELRGPTDDHYAKGFTAEKGESFSGRHQEYMGFLMDEGSGIESLYWETTKTMFQPKPGHWWVVFFNPLSLACQAYREEKRGGWHVVEMSALDHPNVTAGLRGEPEPFPGAVSLPQVNTLVNDFCDPVTDAEREPQDVQWPPEEFRKPHEAPAFYRPSPQFEYRVLGRWPSGDVFGVWSRKAWGLCQRDFTGLVPPSVYPEFGVDVAAHGEDFTVIHGRWGPFSYHHERHNGWWPSQTAERLKVLCAQAAKLANDNRLAQMPHSHDSRKIEPEEILVKIDADGLGVNLMDPRNRGDFRFVGVCGSGRPIKNERYYNKRAELWFDASLNARDGQVSVARLSKKVQDLLEEQLLGVLWWPDPTTGKCLIEPKDDTKKRIGCSPDDADAFLLAWAGGTGYATDAWREAFRERAFEENEFAAPSHWLPPQTVNAPGGEYTLAYGDDDFRGGRRWLFGA